MRNTLILFQVKPSSDIGALAREIKFPQYIKQTQDEKISTTVLQNQGLNRENSATLFCPSGFTFESADENAFSVERDFPVKLEDTLYSESK